MGGLFRAAPAPDTRSAVYLPGHSSLYTKETPVCTARAKRTAQAVAEVGGEISKL